MENLDIIKIFGGNKYCKKEGEWYNIYRFEPYFNKNVCVAYYSPKRNSVRPTHGYYPPHNIGKSIKKICEKNGINYECN